MHLALNTIKPRISICVIGFEERYDRFINLNRLGTTMASEKSVYSGEFPDGVITLKESYVNGELHLVSVEDSRDKIVDELYSNRAESVLFIFRVYENKLQISRIFAQTDNGGYALDNKRTLSGGFRESFDRISLMDEEALSIVHQRYPDKRIDKQLITDKIRNLYNLVVIVCKSRWIDLRDSIRHS